MIKRSLCLFTGHPINRKQVWHDGLDFRTKCPRCGKALVRDMHGWREFDEVRDAVEGRATEDHGS